MVTASLAVFEALFLGVYCLTCRYSVSFWLPDVDPAYSRTWHAGNLCSVMSKNSVVDIRLLHAGRKSNTPTVSVTARRQYFYTNFGFVGGCKKTALQS